MYKCYNIEAEKDIIDDKDKLEVKGIDIVRSSFPASFRKFMDLFVRKLLSSAPKKELDEMILKFRDEIDKFDIIDIAKTTSVKFISLDNTKNYNPPDRKPFQFIKGTPVQVKAGLGYNDLIKFLKIDTMVEPIYNGQKIKYVYVQKNEYGLESMALKGDGYDSDEILKFVNKYVDRKFFPIIQQLKDGSFEFNHLILCLITPSGARYRLLVKNRNFKYERIVTI